MNNYEEYYKEAREKMRKLGYSEEEIERRIEAAARLQELVVKVLL